MKSLNLKAIIKNNQIEIEDKENFNLFKKLNEGVEILIRMQKYYRLRTDPQNKYYWGVIIKILQEYTGEDERDRIHDALKEKFIDKLDVLGERVSKGTSNMSTVEFEEYASEIRQWASRDLNCYIPEPNEAGAFAYKPEEQDKDKKINLT
jgi:hypothetical protein